jgi:hypothetical protein
MKVTNMICVQCDQTHDRDHLPGCPRLQDDPDYARGWLAARTAYGRMAAEHVGRERARIIGALREVVDVMERSS